MLQRVYFVELDVYQLTHPTTRLTRYDDWADNTTLTRFLTVTLVVPHYDLFELSRRLTIPGIADWIIWSVMLLQIVDDVALFVFVLAHLGYHGRVGSLRRMVRMELVGLVLASILWSCLDPTWFSDICLYGAIFVRNPHPQIEPATCRPISTAARPCVQ